jgi:hypothetical protein
MYMGLMMLDKVKCIQLNHYYPNLFPLPYRWISKELKRCTPPDNDPIPAQPFQTGGRKVHSETHEVLIKYIWNMEEFPQ